MKQTTAKRSRGLWNATQKMDVEDLNAIADSIWELQKEITVFMNNHGYTSI